MSTPQGLVASTGFGSRAPLASGAGLMAELDIVVLPALEAAASRPVSTAGGAQRACRVAVSRADSAGGAASTRALRNGHTTRGDDHTNCHHAAATSLLSSRPGQTP